MSPSKAEPAAARVLVVDDGTMVRQCLTAQLEANGLETASAWDLPSLFSETADCVPDVVLLNITTPDSATLLQVSLDLAATTNVIVYGLSTDREPEIIACAESGVAGLHLKSETFEHLLNLISNARAGQAQCSPEVSAILVRRVYAYAAQQNPDSNTDSLTVREKEILELLEQGLTNQQIANRLSLTLHTVKNHVHNLLTKMGVASRAEAVAVARANKYANP